MRAQFLRASALALSFSIAASSALPSANAVTVTQAITSIQSSNPTLPAGVDNPKGNIGFLLANLFWSASDAGYDSSKFGKIKPNFVDGSGATAWTYVSGNTTLTDVSAGKVGIGTASPSASLEVRRTAADSNFAAWIEGADSANYGLGVNVANTTSAKAVADFRSGNVSKLFVRADGNVGIGTTNPTTKLQVAGKASATGFGANQGAPDAADSSTNGFSFGADGDTGMFGPGSGNSAGILAFYSNNAEKLRINGNGVGINTTSPRSMLDVAGGIVAGDSSGYAFFVPKFGTDPWTNYDRFEVRVDPSSQVTWMGNTNGGTGSARALAFVTGNVEKMRVDTSGYVGIGTATPGTRLDVVGEVRGTGGTFTDNTSQSTTVGALKLNAANGAIVIDDAGQKRISWNDAGGNFNIRGGNYYQAGTGVVYAKGAADANGGAAAITISTDTTDGTITLNTAPIGTPGSLVSYTSGLVLNSGNSYFWGSGNVGIGTAAPSIKFAVGDSDTGLQWLGDGQIDLYSNNVSSLSARSGDIGIGTQTPGAKLEVAGQVKITGGSPGFGKVLTSDTGGLATWTTPATLTEYDPKVGTNTANYLSKWNGSQLVASSVFDNGTNVGLGAPAWTYRLEVSGDVLNNGWYRSQGSTGWYNNTYGGGWNMTDSTWIRGYGGKSLWMAGGLIGGDGGLTVGYGGTTPNTSGGAVIIGSVGIGTSSPAYKLDVAGTVNATAFRLPTGASAGKVLTSDASGNATWATAAAGTAHSTRVVTANCMDTGAGECATFSASCNASTEVLTWGSCARSTPTGATTSTYSCWGVAQWVTGTAYAICLAK